jgi:hypothetical protein
MLNIKYTITFSSTNKLIDPSGQLSNEDSTQHQSQYSSNNLINAGSKKIEVIAFPTNSSVPNAGRIYDLNLESLQVKYLRILHIKSPNQFLVSTSDTLENLISAPRTLARDFVLDAGERPDPNVFTPDLPFPKYIRLMNPLEINGGGTGNDPSDVPITISLFIVSTNPTF